MREALSQQHAVARAWAQVDAKVFVCKAGSKRPGTKHGHKDSTTNLEKIDAWYSENPLHNPAMCPADAGLFVIDIDPGADLSILDRLPATYMVRTPRGGKHFYYEGTGPSTVGKLAPHVDTRSEGGYVLLAGSVVNGQQYVAENDLPYAPLPAWVTEALAAPGTPLKAAVEGMDLPGNVERARARLRQLVAIGDVAIEGQGGNARAYQVGCELRDLGLSVGKMIEVAEEWNAACAPPWTTEELTTIFENATRYQQNEPSAHGVEPAQEVFKDVVKNLAAQEQSTPGGKKKQETGRKRIFTTRADDKDLPQPSWLVKGLLPANADIMIYGPSGACKSFLAIDIAASIAAAMTRADTQALGTYDIVEPGAVFYCAAEGDYSVRKQRITAWEIARSLEPHSLKYLFVAPIPPFLNGDNIQAIIADAKAYLQELGVSPALWVVDTMNRALNGCDEDSSATASAYLNMLTMLRNEVGGSTLTVHHTGKEEGRGPRGSSAFYAGFDTVILIDRKKEEDKSANSILTVEIKKQKDEEEGEPFFLKTQKIMLPDNRTSLVLEAVTEDEAKRATGKAVGLRRTEVGAALMAMGAYPGGVNEWNPGINKGGISTRTLATHLAQTEAAGQGRNHSARSVHSLVAILNKGAAPNGPYEAYVIYADSKGRQWAIAPGINGEASSDV